MSRRAWSSIAFACVAAAIIWHGNERTSSGPAEGTSFSGDVAQHVVAARSNSDSRRIRIGTFNIHSGKGADEIRDLQRTAECLRGADVLGLNEVRGASWTGATDQAESLGRELGLSWLFAPAERRWWRDDFGNAALTSLPVACWQRIPLARHASHSFHNVVLLGLEVGDRRLHVLVTHLDRANESERSGQLRAVGNIFLALAEPAVLMGDLNTSAGDSELSRLLSTPGVADPLAEILQQRYARRIDWILTRGLHCLDRGVADTGASDHPYFWIDCELPAK